MTVLYFQSVLFNSGCRLSASYVGKLLLKKATAILHTVINIFLAEEYICDHSPDKSTALFVVRNRMKVLYF